MTPDQYVLSVISKYRVPTGPGSAAYNAGQSLYPVIASWANRYLLGVTYSGSYAKGTAVHGSSDVDLFISLIHDTPGTLGDVYFRLVQFLTNQRLSPRPQHVSVSVQHSGITVDLVPGRKQSGNTTDHSLYRRKANTWTQTNVDTHMSLVRNSGRLDEIRAVKIWRQLHLLDFPSFYLELTVIDALRGAPWSQPGANFLKVLNYIAGNLQIARVLDPANSGNIISDDLTSSEKRRIASQAAISKAMSNWGQIIWQLLRRSVLRVNPPARPVQITWRSVGSEVGGRPQSDRSPRRKG